MYFHFALDLSDIDLYLLDTDIPSKPFVCLQDVFKTYLEDFFKTLLAVLFILSFIYRRSSCEFEDF